MRLCEDLGGFPEGGKVMVGFDDCLFDGDVEGALVRVMLGDWLGSESGLDFERVFPSWFKLLMADKKDLEGAPQNYGAIIELANRIKASCGRSVINGDKIQVINDVMKLDRMLMEWVVYFFQKDVSTRFFVERSRWFDGVSPEALAATITTLKRQNKLPALRQDVLALIEQLKVGREVNLITGTVREVVMGVLAAHEGWMEKLGLAERSIYSSKRGRCGGVRGRIMSHEGARPLHPKAKADLMVRIGCDVRVAVLAARNCEPPDPVAHNVLANGGVVVAV